MNEAVFRPATAGDVAAIVALLADDVLGAARENPGDPVYDAAFAAIAAVVAAAGALLSAL